MASEPARPATIRRFGRTERVAHWLLAATFLAMLATGLVLYYLVTGRSPYTEKKSMAEMLMTHALEAPTQMTMADVIAFDSGDREAAPAATHSHEEAS